MSEVICTRVYLNGTQKSLKLKEDEVEPWVQYNQTFRFGCALFVGNKCVYSGCFKKEDADKIELKSLS